MNPDYISLITTSKNRSEHFLQTFPSFITQYGVNYEFVLVDFGSSDFIKEKLVSEIEFRKIMFSPYLCKVIYVRLMEDLKFNHSKAKNLGAAYSGSSNILAFTDVDVFLGMDYLRYGSSIIEDGKSFFATRQQDTRGSYPKRMNNLINYGNCFIFKKDFCVARGWDESIGKCGGNDDDLFHRLKLNGLREINPINHFEARHYNILHGDEIRLKYIEDPIRGNVKDQLEEIYSNTNPSKSQYDFLLKKDGVEHEELYVRG